MEVPKIPPVEVEATAWPGLDGVGRARGLEVGVSEPPQVGGTGEGFTPLELFLLGLASCEASMFRMVASRMGISFKSVNVRVTGSFKIGEGLVEAKIKYIIHGAEGDVKKVVEGVRSLCPVFNTLRRAGVRLEEEVELAP